MFFKKEVVFQDFFYQVCDIHDNLDILEFAEILSQNIVLSFKKSIVQQIIGN